MLMTNLMTARLMMSTTLMFHIVFAVLGIGMPLLMIIAEGLWLKKREPVYLAIAKQWSKAFAVLFAIGAVSGTVISFEMGLLWPKFMAFAGPVIGLPFSLEGFAFFVEAIFVGVYLYGWDRVPPRLHWLSGCLVAGAAAASGVLVVSANGWMNTPAGFDVINGKAANINVWAAMLNTAAFTETLHMTLAAFLAAGFGVAAVHALMILRDSNTLFHKRAFAIAFSVGAIFAVLEPMSGDVSARYVAKNQPIKLAAMEGQWETEKRAPLRIGGYPDMNEEKTKFAIEIPHGLSLLAFHNPNAEIIGLKSVPRDERPFSPLVHASFDIMVGIGFALMGLGLLGFFLAWRMKRLPDQKWFLLLTLLFGPLGFVAVETGWIVTEVGRQPWIIYNLMKTADAVTPMPGLIIPFIGFMLIYALLTFTLVVVLKKLIQQSPKGTP